MIINDATQLIGNTPVVKLNNIPARDRANIYLKLEYFNVSRSVKDRPALNMIIRAENNGQLKPGGTIIEPTSGNTGIALAMIAAVKNYQCIIVMPDNVTEERIKIIEAYGANVILTPSKDSIQGAIDKVKKLASKIDGSFVPDQFKNPANPAAHRKTTACEILEDFNNNLHAFVSTAGTGGTITGTGEELLNKLPELDIYTVEPEKSPVLAGGKPEPHNIPGTGPGFIPKILNTDIYKKIFHISDNEVIQMVHKLAKKEGLLLGPSSAAAVWAAVKVADNLKKDKNVLAIAPDTGERYLSQNIF